VFCRTWRFADGQRAGGVLDAVGYVEGKGWVVGCGGARMEKGWECVGCGGVYGIMIGQVSMLGGPGAALGGPGAVVGGPGAVLGGPGAALGGPGAVSCEVPGPQNDLL